MGAAAAVSAMRVWGANDRIPVAIVGIGGRGTTHLKTYAGLPGAQIVGLCDVNQPAREKAQAFLTREGHDKAKEFIDMRDAFADKDVHAVSIATPNHWHALASIWAMQAGKDVYCEKPASYNIYEGGRMMEVARSTKRMLQIGSQHRSTPFKIRAMAALHGGLIGDIYQARGLCFKRRKSIGHKEDSPTPPGLDWDMFLGPAPMRPFNELRFAYNWHWFWDTGNGDIGNQGVHQLGVARWAMGDPGWPKAAYAQGGKYAYTDDQETPNTLAASYDYGGRELIFEVRGLHTNAEGSIPKPRKTAPTSGVKPLEIMVGNLFYGTEGWAAMNDSGFQAFKGESNELVLEEKDGDENTTSLHMQNFLDAVHSRNHEELHDEIAIAAPSAALCHLANISYRVGRRLTLENGPKFVDDAEATKMITREKYRKPYVV
ncbi:MAG: Gfo/Idh/MocA family oxidoreductase [Bryobacterales bacterium]